MKKKLLLHFSFYLIILLCNGCSLQYGIYNPKDLGIKEVLDDKGIGAVNISTPSFWNDNVDINIGVEAWRVATWGTGQLESYIKLTDYYASMRYYPLGANKVDFFVKPYIGGSIGYFNLGYTQESKGDYIGPSKILGAGYVDYEIDYNTNSWANGFYPNILFGVKFPISLDSGEVGFLIEDRIDIWKSNNGIDFSGNILLFGLYWNLWNE